MFCHLISVVTSSSYWINPLKNRTAPFANLLTRSVRCSLFTSSLRLKRMLLQVILVTSLYASCSLAGLCQEMFKNPAENQPFFKVHESRGVEIYYPKRDKKHKMFGIEIYKNPDLNQNDRPCDLCVYTTRDGCFRIRNSMLAVKTRDVLKYNTLAKFVGDIDVRRLDSKVVKFTDYILPAECECPDPPGGYCSRASRNTSEYRPLFKYRESKHLFAYLPTARSTSAVARTEER